MRAVAEAAREQAPDACAAAEFASGLALLGAAYRDPGPVAGLLARPHLSAWAAGCLRRLAAGSSPAESLALDLGHLNAVAAAAGVRTGCPVLLRIPVRGGLATLPSLGSARLRPHGAVAPDAGQPGPGPGPAPSGGWATVRWEPGAPLTVTIDGAEVSVRPRSGGGRASAGWLPVRRIELGRAGGPGGPVVEVEDTDPFRDCYYWDTASRLTGAEFAELTSTLRSAWALLARDHPGRAAELAAAPLAVVPLRRPAAGHEVSAASRHAFGSIGTSLPADPAALAEILVHEFQHVKLGALLDLMPMCREPGTARYYAPWREDPRPVGALLQGAYAHLGVADYWRVRQRVLPDPAREVAAGVFARRHAQTSVAVSALRESDELTEAGRQFVAGMAAAQARWQGELDGDAASAAWQAVLADQAAWGPRPRGPAACA